MFWGHLGYETMLFMFRVQFSRANNIPLTEIPLFNQQMAPSPLTFLVPDSRPILHQTHSGSDQNARLHHSGSGLGQTLWIKKT